MYSKLKFAIGHNNSDPLLAVSTAYELDMLTVAMDYLQRKMSEAEEFPNVYKLLATIDTFGCSTAVCESSFSTIARIGTPIRISMTNERLRRLTLLAFESKRLGKIDVEDVLKTFNPSKERKAQLY